ncbi:MAG: hypothetical protein PHQ02_06935 [Candidatus Riflebacteria bacterium]|nr:hypothetical protein [Candidatus Riflebacteria bacterium]
MNKELPTQSDDVFKSRKALREFCIKNKVAFPEFFVSEDFAKISAWAIKHNKFPMAIKAEEDSINEENSYLLKAFRELPECFDLIKAKAKNIVIVEEFIEGKPKIEVCCLKGKIRMFSQISLEKSIILKHSWRAFPISVPAKIAKDIKDIIDKFKPYCENLAVPVRFSFAINKSLPVLISADAGLMRPEYNKEWAVAANIPPILEESGLYKCDGICKVVYKRNVDFASFNPDTLKSVCAPAFVLYQKNGEDLIVFLKHADAQILQKASIFSI